MFAELKTGGVRDEVRRKRNGDLEMLFPNGSSTFQLVWENSYGRGVFNPDDSIEGMVMGARHADLGGRKLLFGTHHNGICPADCLACPFGRTVMAEYGVLARPITPVDLKLALERAREIAMEEGMLQQGEKYSAGALLSGDPGYNPHVAEMIGIVGSLANCRASRWSTIAPDTANDVLAAFIEGARQNSGNHGHTLSFQVSLHSTDFETRVKHTGIRRLKPSSEIARASEEITKITGRRLSLAFMLHAETIIDPAVLAQNFSTGDNIISLRPIWTSEGDSVHIPMDPQRILALYAELRKKWDVVYMPPNITSGGDGRPPELDNMVPAFLRMNG